MVDPRKKLPKNGKAKSFSLPHHIISAIIAQSVVREKVSAQQEKAKRLNNRKGFWNCNFNPPSNMECGKTKRRRTKTTTSHAMEP